MSDAGTRRTVTLGSVHPARSRQRGRRSAVALADGVVAVGTADGVVRGLARPSLAERWRVEAAGEDSSVVAVTPFAGGVAVGERGPDGGVGLYDGETGDRRWRYPTARDVGDAQRRSRFSLPFVAALDSTGDRLYVASRRYERDGDRRSFTAVVYAFDADGDVRWRYRTDASPICVDVRDGRLAVGYNRCPGSHQHGLVVLDAETGAVRYDWDPGTEGERRVGDASLVEGGVAVASHGDYCGYRLDDGGAERWRVGLATPTEVGDETLYAYPTHVHATSEGVVFVTGNTYASGGRETDALHPHEHTAVGCSASGERVWSASVGGFAHGIGVDGRRVAVPGAQHFRTRDPGVHGVRTFDVAGGPRHRAGTDGVVTAVALDGRVVAAVEEPVVYHDDGRERGGYRLLVDRIE